MLDINTQNQIYEQTVGFRPLSTSTFMQATIEAQGYRPVESDEYSMYVGAYGRFVVLRWKTPKGKYANIIFDIDR